MNGLYEPFNYCRVCRDEEHKCLVALACGHLQCKPCLEDSRKSEKPTCGVCDKPLDASLHVRFRAAEMNIGHLRELVITGNRTAGLVLQKRSERLFQTRKASLQWQTEQGFELNHSSVDIRERFKNDTENWIMTFPVFNTLKNRIGNTPADKRWKVAISMFFPKGKEILSKFHLTAAMARELSQILPEDKPNMYIHAAFWQSVILPPLEFKSPDWDDGTGWCWSNALIGSVSKCGISTPLDLLAVLASRQMLHFRTNNICYTDGLEQHFK